MKVKKILTGLVFSLAVAGIFYSCAGDSTKNVKPEMQSMIVIFSTGAKIKRAGSEEAIDANVGTVVRQGDTIITEKGTVDLQTRDGSAIRVREFTSVSVKSLTPGNTELSMKGGTILANVKRKAKSDKFRVVTPTAIAGVRGTTFKVELLDDDEPPRVKVVNGRVAMSPRIKSLTKYSKEDIAKSPTLTKLANLEKQEVILDEKTEGTLSKKLEKQVKSADQALANSKSVEEIEKQEDIISLTKDIDSNKTESVIKKESEITVQEIQETSTLVAVDTEVFDKVASGKNANELDNLKKVHEKQRKAKQERILRQIEVEASKKELKTEDAIKKQYNKLELVIMKDGTKIRGAVIAQTGNVLVIHSSKGVKRVNKSAVLQQDFLYSE